MSNRFFVVMQAMSGNDRHETRFQSFTSLQEAEAMIQGWMTRYMAIDCIPADQVEEVEKANGGELPDGAFACPEVKVPKDLMKYSGYHNAGGLGYLFNMFIYVADDKESALKFRGDLNREYRIDTEYSARADRMLGYLNTFVESFEHPELDVAEAEAAILDFMKKDGFNPFEVVEEYDEITDMSDRWGI